MQTHLNSLLWRKQVILDGLEQGKQHRIYMQWVCWTYHTHLSMSDDGGVQDQASQTILRTQIPQIIQKDFYPTRTLLHLTDLMRPYTLDSQINTLINF